jgi:fibronectin-binding autotransporter adhesin
MQRADRGSAPGDGGLALHTRGDAGDAPSIAAFTNPDGQEPPLTTSTWNVSASGDWSDASDWSGGVPNSSTADATISEAGTYTVDIAAAESFTVGSVTLNDAGATLDVGGTLNLTSTLTLTAGKLLLTGTINGGTINTGGGTFSSNFGILNGVTVDGTINLSATDDPQLTITGGLSMQGAGGNGSGTIDFGIGNSQLMLSGTETISNTTIDTIADNDGILTSGTGTITFASSDTINIAHDSAIDGGGIVIGNVFVDNTGGAVVSDATINANAQGGVGLSLLDTYFTNAGTITVANGSTLSVGSEEYATSFLNDGTISIDGTSTINYYCPVTTAQLGTLNIASGAAIYFEGSLDNAGSTYQIPTGVVVSGTLDGGMIEGTINVPAADTDGLPYLALTGNIDFEGSGGSGSGTINLQSPASQLDLLGPATLNNVVINISTEAGSASGGIGAPHQSTVTLGSNVTINQTGSDNEISFLGGTIINDGTIDAGASGGSFTIGPQPFIGSESFTNAGNISVTDGDTLNVLSNSFSNTGTISVDGTSTLNFGVTLTTAEMGIVDATSGATLYFQDLDNAGTTYVLPVGVNLGGSIYGGTVQGTINLTAANAQFQLDDGVRMTGAGGTGPGVVDDTGSNSTLGIEGTGTFSNATINVGSSNSFDPSNIYASGTIGANVTINQSGAATYATLGGGGTNDGTINLSSSGGTFTMTNGPFTNAGTIAISNGDTLDIGTFGYDDTFINTGTVSVAGGSSIDYVNAIPTADLGTIDAAGGGTLDFAGTLDNTGATFVVPAGAVIEGVIQGGTIEGTLSVAYEPSAPFSIELTSSVTFEGPNGTGSGTIDVDGTLLLAGTATLGNVTLNAGGGVVEVAGDSAITLASNVTLNNVGIEIEPNLAVPVQGSVVDDGSIVASSKGGTLTIEIPDFTNTGTITVTSGDTLYIESLTGSPTTFVNTGTISVDGTSTLEVDVGLTTAQLGTIDAAAGATIEFYGVLNNTGATYEVPTGTFVEGTVEGGTLEGSFNVTGINPLELSGTMTVANATIDVGAPSAAGAAIINVGGGVVTIGSTATIEQTVTGTAAFLGEDANSSTDVASVGTVVNDGTVISDVSGSAFGVDPDIFTNNGLLEAANGGELLVGSNSFTNLTGTTLTGGSYEASRNSTFEFVNFTTIVTDDATIILSGANSVMKQLNPTTNVTVTLESTLTSTGTSGILSVQAGRDWTQTTAFTNAGIIELGGGTFQVSSLTNSGTILGFGTVSGAVTDSGALIAFAGTLGFQGGSFSGISGTLASGMMVGAGANATLQLPGNISIATLDGEIALSGSGATIQSLNGSAEVTVQSTLKTIAASGVLEVGDTYTSSNVISNAGTIQMGGGTLSTGLLTDSAGSNLYGDGTVASVFSDSGSVTSTGGALVFTGSGDTFANALGGQQVTFGGGTDLLQSGSNLTAREVSISGSAAVAFATSQSYAGTWNQGAGTVNLGGNTLTLSGTGSSIGGTVSGSGTLAFTGGSQAIGSGASLTVSNWTLSGSDAVSVNTSLTYAGTFSAAAGTTLTMSSGDTLTLTGTTTFAGSTAGPGTLSFSGGTETWDGGASLGSNLAIHSAAKVALGGSVSVAGALSQAAGTSVAIGAGETLTLSGTGSSFAGAVTGTGTLAFSGGTDKLSAGTNLAVSNLSLSSGATASLAWSLAYAGDLSEAAGTTFALNSYALTLSGAGSTIAGAITGTAGGGLTFSGGSQAFDSGATLTTVRWTLSGTDAVALDENLSYGGTFSAAAGTTLTIASGDTLTLNGVATIVDKISGTGSLAFTGGSQTLNGGTTLAGSSWTISGSDAVKLDASVSYGGPFSAGAGTTLTIASGDTLTLTGASTFAGSTAGAGTLELSFGAETFEAGAHFGSLVSLHSAAQASVNGAVSISGALLETAGTAIAIGGTLTLSGTGSAFAGAVTGTGTLAFSGGTDKLSAGTNLAVSDLSLSSGATASLAWSLAYAGDISEAAGTTFALGPYTLTLSGAGSTISGAITGAGDLTLSGGSQAFDSGATLTTAKWTLSGTDTVALNENLTYAGTYSQAATTSLTVATGDTLALTGTASLAGTVTGGGTVSVSNGTVSGLVVGGTLDDLGTVHQTGLVTIGDSSSNAATLSIASGDSYDIGANVNIAIGASAASAIDDNGLLIKNGGTGISIVALGIVDNGQVEAATGTLELSKAVTGSGTMTVEAGATLELGSSAAATLGLTFGGASATLALTNPASFAATIEGFAATDKIDLVNIAATAATLETGDRLLITDGATTVATLQLTGTYTGFTFDTVADGHGGTDITATAPGAPREPGGDQAPAGNTFDFQGQFGNVTITDHSGGHDMLVFDRADFADAASVEAHATQNALGDTIVTLDPHDTITLVGVSLNRFEANAADWHFV